MTFVPENPRFSNSYSEPSLPISDIGNSKSEIQNILALFQKRIDGDDALLRLAALRFREVGLGAEFYAEDPAELNRIMEFMRGAESMAAVHLSRTLNILEEEHQKLIVDIATSSEGRLFGLVIHDQPEMATRQDQYVAALRDLGTKLGKIRRSPMLFLEYAAGLDPELFLDTLRLLKDWEAVSGCLDIGHIGLWRVQNAYSKRHPRTQVFSLSLQDPQIQLVIEDVQRAVRSALDTVLEVVQAAGSLGKPLHFHLHDGHPLSQTSPFGESDHLSFLEHIPIDFEYRGKYSLDLMFGPCGLVTIMATARRMPAAAKSSFSLEIHPTEGRLALGEDSSLFDHWLDKTNAERMNFWLSVVQQNSRLLTQRGQ
jgi:hypothetical protein